ncbi:Signal peptidase I [hydrothermal vent metagenome]|uniref:signal peptidase I n=1 Tax=hydrothermal vent metagenome TaxID=652676 RepID=A0A1W1CPV8_9ZZZZ
MKPFLHAFGRFASSWTGTFVIVLFLIFFVAQSFVIPSGSMKRTQLIGDFLFAKKFSYGIPIPHLPWLEIPLVPDFNDNGHLIEGDRPERADIVIFRYPKNNAIHYVKRCVAVGGDEVLYGEKKLMIHFHEGDEYIKANYPKESIVTLYDKLWVVNPYMLTIPGIQYVPEGNTGYEYLTAAYNYNKEIDMSIRRFTHPDGKEEHLFYKKVEPDHFYMVGDNRDNSNDSRFWGSVPYKLVVGQPWLTYMSIEFRSYEQVFDGIGGGRDHDKLDRICGDIDFASKECESLWNKQRYTIRWGRVGRLLTSLEKEQPIE